MHTQSPVTLSVPVLLMTLNSTSLTCTALPQHGPCTGILLHGLHMIGECSELRREMQKRATHQVKEVEATIRIALHLDGMAWGWHGDGMGMAWGWGQQDAHGMA